MTEKSMGGSRGIGAFLSMRLKSVSGLELRLVKSATMDSKREKW
jgi:hypothetical protein